MSSNNLLNAVEHYQRSIEKNPTDVARLLHCVGKLYKMPITVEHLQQTGVGRTVNALRKHDGELGVAAEAVVNKWKQLVAAESDTRAGNQSSENEQDLDDEDDDKNSEKNMETNYSDSAKIPNDEHTVSKQYSHSANKTENPKNYSETNKNIKHDKSASSSSTHNHDRHSHHKSEHRDKSKRHHSSKDSHKRDDREQKAHKSHSKAAEKEKSENKSEKHSTEEHKSKTDSSKKHKSSKDKVEQHKSNGKHKHGEKHHSSKEKDKSSKSKTNSEHKSQSSSPSIVKCSSVLPCNNEPSISVTAVTPKASTSGAKRRHEEDEEKGNSPKKPKTNIHHNEKQSKQGSDTNEGDMDDGIDSSMGANFEDVLGMLNMPQKKAKKSLNALKNTSPKSGKKASECDNSKSSSTSKMNGIRNTEMPSSSSSSSFTSQRKLEKKPDLLTSKVKLPPLDPSIALELPLISNNYKPLPLNPTVMDCVFNSTTSSSSRAPPRLLSDAEALSHGISSKTMRTKVYSGVKTGQLLQVPTLFDLCIRVLQKNIDALEYTGGVPFDVLRPVLERATPQQLFTFEEYNPYLMEDSDVLWKQHVQRNYRSHKRQEMESWREMFMRCQEDQERRLSMLAENIKQSQKAIALPVRKTQLAFVDSMVKPPRNVVRKQEQYGTKSKLVATPAARVAALCNVTPNAAKQGDARLRVAAAFAQDPVKNATAPMRQKKAPLMAKTIQFMRGRLKR